VKIAVIDDYADAFRQCRSYARLEGHEVTVFRDTEKDPGRLAARLKDAEVVVLTQARSRFPRAVIEQLPRLRMIAQTGRNTSHIDVAACTEKGILIATAGADASHAVAELTWGLILAALRHIPHEVERMKQGEWQNTVGTGLHGKTLGLYGFDLAAGIVGGVGRAFGMQVLCWEGPEPGGKAREAGFDAPSSRDALFESADVVSLHIALNKETRGSIIAADLARMKPTALIVNAMRSKLIADGALAETLKRGRPGWAAVDVYDEEPVVAGTLPLLGLPNVVCAPHLGNVEWGVLEKLYAGAVDGILGFAAGKPVNVFKPEAIQK